MKILPLDTPEIIELAAGWLAQKENYQWLDFGGRVIVTPALLKIMAQRDTNFLRVYTADRDDIPLGIIGLNHVDHAFKTATFWGGVRREILPQPGVFDHRQFEAHDPCVQRSWPSLGQYLGCGP